MNKPAILLALALATLAAACADIPLGEIRDTRISPGTSPTPPRVN
jgi:hypothetical protein